LQVGYHIRLAVAIVGRQRAFAHAVTQVNQHIVPGSTGTVSNAKWGLEIQRDWLNGQPHRQPPDEIFNEIASANPHTVYHK
jgi:hypothetical protein